MRRFAAICALAGAALVLPGVAMAAPPMAVAAQQCAQLGGSFNNVSPSEYHCQEGSFSDLDLLRARQLCENAYKGSFSGVPGSYHCHDIEGELTESGLVGINRIMLNAP